MDKFIYTLIFISLLSCSSTKTLKIVRDHGECYVATLNFDNTLNDTSRIKFIRSVVFDTTATLVHGYIIDSKTLLPIQNTEVKLFSRDNKITLLTNSNGEFKIFQNLYATSWNMYFSHSDYICLYVTDVIQSGGQWFYIKLEHK
jgi:hypothetical protein